MPITGLVKRTRHGTVEGTRTNARRVRGFEDVGRIKKRMKARWGAPAPRNMTASGLVGERYPSNDVTSFAFSTHSGRPVVRSQLNNVEWSVPTRSQLWLTTPDSPCPDPGGDVFNLRHETRFGLPCQLPVLCMVARLSSQRFLFGEQVCGDGFRSCPTRRSSGPGRSC